MMISELLWVGEGPSSSVGTNGIVHCATAERAAEAVHADYIAVVPTIDVAHDAILVMGYSQDDADHVTRWRRDIDPDDPSTYQLCEPRTYNETTNERRHRV